MFTKIKMRSMMAVAVILLAMAAGVSEVRAASFIYANAIAGGDTDFSRFNIDTNTWQTLTPHRSDSQLATDQDGKLYSYNQVTNTIETYNPTNDSWATVVSGPANAGLYQVNLEVTNDGRFLMTSRVNSNLYVNQGGSWSTNSLGFQPNATGDYDPSTNQFVIGQLGSRNVHVIDLTSPGYAVTDLIQAGSVGEVRRAGSILNNKYYTNANNFDPFDVWDLSNNTFSGTIAQGSNSVWASTTADRYNGYVYAMDLVDSNRFSGDFEFYRFNAAGTKEYLPSSGVHFNHSTLAFVPDSSLLETIPTPSASLAGLIGFGVMGVMRRKRKA